MLGVMLKRIIEKSLALRVVELVLVACQPCTRQKRAHFFEILLSAEPARSVGDLVAVGSVSSDQRPVDGKRCEQKLLSLFERLFQFDSYQSLVAITSLFCPYDTSLVLGLAFEFHC